MVGHWFRIRTVSPLPPPDPHCANRINILPKTFEKHGRSVSFAVFPLKCATCGLHISAHTKWRISYFSPHIYLFHSLEGPYLWQNLASKCETPGLHFSTHKVKCFLFFTFYLFHFQFIPWLLSLCVNLWIYNVWMFQLQNRKMEQIWSFQDIQRFGRYLGVKVLSFRLFFSVSFHYFPPNLVMWCVVCWFHLF